MSTSKNHTIRYVLMIFPALAIIVAKTFSDWFDSRRKEQLTCGLAGIVCLTALFVNATPFLAKVTLGESSKEVRQLASIIKLNISENIKLGNFRLSFWNPKHAMLFYSDRGLESPIKDTEELLKQLKNNPKKMWLSNSAQFNSLKSQMPDAFYLIQANSKYAFFTSSHNRDFVKYDFSKIKIPNVK
jgi:hypothetical protein